MKRLLPFLLAALMFAGCAAAPGLPAGTATPLHAVTMPKAPAEDDYEARAALRQRVDEEQMGAALDFAIQSAQTVLGDGETGQNRLYSPLSLYFALAMLAETAGGETREQVLSALSMDESALDKTGDLYRFLYADDKYTHLLLANSAWIHNGQDDAPGRAVAFHPQTLETLARAHFAEVFSADLAGAGAGEAIGKWISKQTNGLLGSGFEVPPETLMLLLNTVYFKSEWTSRFNVQNTTPGAFHNGDGTEGQCDFMHKTTMQSFARTEQYTSAALGLKGGSIRFILPSGGRTPQDILTGGEWAEALMAEEDTGYGDVTWQVPKLDYNESISLNEAAKALGVRDAMDPDKADFTPLSDSPLYVSAIHQQSAISMDENGIEAASYTDIAYAGAAMPSDQAEMILNRPFIYIVYASGLPLFVGVVNAM